MTPRNSLPILIVTASQNEAEQINGILRKAGYPVKPIWVSNLEDASQSIQQQRPDLILCSTSVAGASFQEIVNLRDMALPNVPIIALSDDTVSAVVAEIINTGARDLISLQQPEHLQAVVARELEVLQLARDLEQKALVLKEYEQRIDLVMNDTKDAIAYVEDGIVLSVNPTFLELFGYASSGELEALPMLELFDSNSHAAIKEALKVTARGKTVKPLKVKGKHGKGQTFDTTIEIARTEVGGTPALEILIRDESSSQHNETQIQIQMQTQVQHQAQAQIDLLSQKLAASVQQLATVRNLDLLTGFINRIHFIEVLRQQLAQKQSKAVRALIYIKPDKFSSVSEKVGIIAGDGIIKGLADLIRGHVDKEDVVARFGGTVFTIIMTRPKLKDIAGWTEKFQAMASNHVFESTGKSTSMHCSIGYVLLDEQHLDPEKALTHALEAYQQARNMEHGKVAAWAPPAIDAHGQLTDDEWKRRLTAALKSNHFMLAYQSIASLAGDAMEALDILLRMRDEQDVEIPNKDFMPAAERVGMMIAIDRWVVERSLRMLEERSQRNQPARLFVRISDQSLTDKSLLPWLEKLLSGVFFSAGHLVFQVAEKSAEKYITDTRALAAGAHRLQCGFALEHFGLGQNPLHTLGLIRQVDYIKIDGSLTAALATEEDKRELVKKFMGRAGELKIHTIAEKVEKPETMAVLYQLGIEYIQGNYIQEPDVVMGDAKEETSAAG
ncbi:MAG: EAL domain-containing protein [Gammaproteobacteria bacterium]|nr:EAL domain-containing protein [Gammaproteobacteria bacterium]MDE2346503.1 EAL domain-containing protein [Gammaproteobacteria bacterium]